MAPELRERILAVLADGKDMTIATVRPDGFPHASVVSFVNDGLDICFGCSPASQKARNISQCDKVSVTVTPDYEQWDEIRGLSAGGIAERVTRPEDVARIGDLMFAKFPQVANYVPEDTGEIAFFRIRPKVVSVLDYTKGFGHCDLVTV